MCPEHCCDSRPVEVPGEWGWGSGASTDVICELRAVTVGIPFLPEDDNLSESSSESFLWSDEECGQDVDVTTNPDEELEGDGRYDFEVVRCICEVQEENDFMIQASRASQHRLQEGRLMLGEDVRPAAVSGVSGLCVHSRRPSLLSGSTLWEL